jgi:hypothetical protein
VDPNILSGHEGASSDQNPPSWLGAIQFDIQN